jgi:hypothetical protein
MGVDGTPTLLLVDETGKILLSWVGKLTPEWERDVINRLGLERADRSSSSSSESTSYTGSGQIIRYNKESDLSKLMTGQEFARILHAGKDTSFVDIRSREDYASALIAGTLNIPLDEIEARAFHEVPKDQTVLIYCHYCPVCENQASEQGVHTFCSAGVDMLTDQGFADVTYMSDDLYTLKQTGFRILQRTSPLSDSR